MKHQKNIHNEKVKQCIYFSTGRCHYSDESCWFNHQNSSKNVIDEDSVIKCKHCEKIFHIGREFMQHRRDYHSEKVPVCTNYLNGNCEYSSCWFKHSQTDEVQTDQNITINLVDMMEKFAEKLSKIEEKIENIS